MKKRVFSFLTIALFCAIIVSGNEIAANDLPSDFFDENYSAIRGVEHEGFYGREETCPICSGIYVNCWATIAIEHRCAVTNCACGKCRGSYINWAK